MMGKAPLSVASSGISDSRLAANLSREITLALPNTGPCSPSSEFGAPGLARLPGSIILTVGKIECAPPRMLKSLILVFSLVCSGRNDRGWFSGMESKPIEGITQLLVRWGGGDKAALDELMPLVYGELRRLAVSHLKREAQWNTMQPTALVHEAYIKLVDQQSTTWRTRAQFYGLATRLMRNILVDNARRAMSQKRGGIRTRLPLTAAEQTSSMPDLNLIELDDALTGLAALRPRHAKVVELRFFGGLTLQETAEVLEVSESTVEREWNFAKAWLRREIGGNRAANWSQAVDGPLVST
jgi:RNA polymerase sigma factor (TIGR02999 family)